MQLIREKTERRSGTGRRKSRVKDTKDLEEGGIRITSLCVHKNESWEMRKVLSWIILHNFDKKLLDIGGLPGISGLLTKMYLVSPYFSPLFSFKIFIKTCNYKTYKGTTSTYERISFHLRRCESRNVLITCVYLTLSFDGLPYVVIIVDLYSE